jgi:hypothetical protein
MTDFRALCAELADCLEKANWPLRHKTLFEICLDTARASLAQPEPQGPSDEELEDFALQNGGGYFNCDCQEEADILTRKHISNYRAVLARWGRPAIEPVPVSERLPKGNDFDAEGCCWPWSRDIYAWCQCFAAAGDSSEWTHWLPHWALPVPQEEGE